MEDNREFRRRLLLTMGKRSMSQLKLAKSIGCAQSTVSQWCRGLTLPTVYYLPLICKALDVSADYLIGLSEV